ncbi:MAG: hypothetical protein ABMA14_06100 [Hyphomonadaceae bacterium]
MARLSSLIVLSAIAVAFAAPALAKISVQGAENLCKAEISTKHPDAKSVKVDKDSTKASGGSFVYTFRVKQADDSSVKLACTVDRSTETVASLAVAS